MTDLRQGVTPTQHEALDALEVLRATMKDEPRIRQIRQAAAYAGIQCGSLHAPFGASDKRRNAIEGAAALMLVAELLELDAD